MIKQLRKAAVLMVIAAGLGSIPSSVAKASADSTAPVSLTYTEPSPIGIPYRWNVEMNPGQHANIEYFVGAKSWWEPTNPPATPGWTHTSNWIALKLDARALVIIDVKPLAGIACTGSLSFACNQQTLVAAGDLYPAVSLYEGIDTTSDQDHVFNPIGNFWSTINYLDSKRNKSPNQVLRFQAKLDPGEYTIDVGGANAFFCANGDPCFTGGQGYAVTIRAR